MIRRLAALASFALVLTACGEGAKTVTTVPAPRPAPVAATPPKPPEVKAEAAPEWVYSSVGKRDPFRSFLAELDQAASAVVTRCSTPLGRFEIDQLRLVAVVTGLDDPIAMVEGPNGVGYSLKRGTCVGRNGGVVAAVRSGEVVIGEWAIKADGSRDKTQTVLRLPKEASLNLEE